MPRRNDILAFTTKEKNKIKRARNLDDDLDRTFHRKTTRFGWKDQQRSGIKNSMYRGIGHDLQAQTKRRLCPHHEKELNVIEKRKDD